MHHQTGRAPPTCSGQVCCGSPSSAVGPSVGTLESSLQSGPVVSCKVAQEDNVHGLIAFRRRSASACVLGKMPPQHRTQDRHSASSRMQTKAVRSRPAEMHFIQHDVASHLSTTAHAALQYRCHRQHVPPTCTQNVCASVLHRRESVATAASLPDTARIMHNFTTKTSRDGRSDTVCHEPHTRAPPKYT